MQSQHRNGFMHQSYSEGKYIAKIPFKVRPQTWKKNKLYTIEEDEEGYQYIKRYKVTWKY